MTCEHEWDEPESKDTYCLPPEQWGSAERFLHLVWKLKRLAQVKVSVELTELRKAYQSLPEGGTTC